MVCSTIKMEPYIKLISTGIDTENKKFIDKIDYDGYEFSFVVSAVDIEKTCNHLDLLFTTPSLSIYPNIANMQYWEFKFYDDKGRVCVVSKTGENIEFVLPRYKPIVTDVSSGILYLRSFYESAKCLLVEVHNPLNTAQIISDDD